MQHTSPTERPYFDCSSLTQMWIDSDTNGKIVCFVRIDLILPLYGDVFAEKEVQGFSMLIAPSCETSMQAI